MVFAVETGDSGSRGEPVDDLADELVSSTSRRFQGVHEVSVNELKGRINGGVFGVLGVSQPVTSPLPHISHSLQQNRQMRRRCHSACS